MNPEPLVHLGLSHKAAKVLEQVIADWIGEYESESYDILVAIRADIKEQLPAPKKGTKRKKGTKK